MGAKRATHAAAILLGGLVTAGSVAAADLVGKANIVDGGTLLLAGKRIELAGIVAPEAGRMCARPDASEYACGQMATFALAGIVETQWVTCRPSAGAGGALRATCTIGPYDIGAEMIRRGWAVADPSDPAAAAGNYAAIEAAARAAGRGLWATGAATRP
jgi:endonuclease YncB( thermonuclease family)